MNTGNQEELLPMVLNELTAIRRGIHYLILIVVLCTVMVIAAFLNPDYIVPVFVLVGILVLVVVVAAVLGRSAAVAVNKTRSSSAK